MIKVVTSKQLIYVSNGWDDDQIHLILHPLLLTYQELCPLELAESFGLKGQVPYELSHLDKLMVLNLSNNQITGSIPNEFE